MRRDYVAVRASGLHISSPDGDLTLSDTAAFQRSADIGIVDWVICAVKATSLEAARDLVAPCIGPQTRILVLMNGLGLEERFASWFVPERIFGGLAFVCLNRGDPGRVRHLAFGAVTLGHLQDRPSELEVAQALWKGARVPIIMAPSLLQARWEKLLWNIPFNGLAVAAGGITTDRILAAADLQRAARDLMYEVIAAGNADLRRHGEERKVDPAIGDRMFALTATMGPYRPSTMIDFVERRPMEIEAMFGEPLGRAQQLGVPTPNLALLTALLRALNVDA